MLFIKKDDKSSTTNFTCLLSLNLEIKPSQLNLPISNVPFSIFSPF